MALQKSKELDTGVTGTYWRVVQVFLHAGQPTEARVLLYKDAQARQDGKAPLTGLLYSWSGADDPCTVDAMDASNPYSLVYAKLKTLLEFSGAQDV